MRLTAHPAYRAAQDLFGQHPGSARELDVAGFPVQVLQIMTWRGPFDLYRHRPGWRLGRVYFRLYANREDPGLAITRNGRDVPAGDSVARLLAAARPARRTPATGGSRG